MSIVSLASNGNHKATLYWLKQISAPWQPSQNQSLKKGKMPLT